MFPHRSRFLLRCQRGDGNRNRIIHCTHAGIVIRTLVSLALLLLSVCVFGLSNLL